MKIGIYGPFGFGNLGDAAIQQAMIQNIRIHLPDAQIIGISLNPEDTQTRHGIPSYPIGRMPEQNKTARKSFIPRIFIRTFVRLPQMLLIAAKIFFYLRDFDLLIVSGGGQLDDTWGGAWKHPFSLFTWAIISKILNVNFIIVSVGAVQTASSMSKFFFKVILRIASYHSFRDLSSKTRVEELGFFQNNFVYPDLAYSICLPEIEVKPPSEKQFAIGISPIAYCHPQVWPKPDQVIYTQYVNKLTVFIIWLLQNGYKVIFCPSQIYYERPVIEEIKTKILATDSDLCSKLEDPSIQSVEDLLVQIAKTDIVIASRYHSVLLSHLLNKPTIALSYDDKVDSLMESAEQSEYCLPIEKFAEDALINKFLDISAHSEQIKVDLETKIIEYRVCLDEQYNTIFSSQDQKIHPKGDLNVIKREAG